MPALRFRRVLGFSALAGQLVDRACDRGDDAGRHARVVRCRAPACRGPSRAWISRMSVPAQADGWQSCAAASGSDGLADPGRLGRLLEQARELTRADMGRDCRLGNSKRSAFGTPASYFVGRLTHHCRSRCEHLRRQHDMPVLASLGLDDADDVLGTVDVARLQPDDLADPEPAAIGQREHRLQPQRLGRSQQTLDLIRAHHQGDLRGSANRIELSGQISAGAASPGTGTSRPSRCRCDCRC